MRLASALPESDVLRLTNAESDSTLSPGARRSASILLALNPNNCTYSVVRRLSLDFRTIDQVLVQYETGGVDFALANPPRRGGRPLAQAKAETVLHLITHSALKKPEIAEQAGVSISSIGRALKEHPVEALAWRIRTKPIAREKPPVNIERYRRLYPRLSQDDEARLVTAQNNTDFPKNVRRWAKVLLALNLDESEASVGRRLGLDHRVTTRAIKLYQTGGVQSVLLPPPTAFKARRAEKRRIVLELGMQPRLSTEKIARLAGVSHSYVFGLLAWRGRGITIKPEVMAAFIRYGNSPGIFPPLSEGDQTRLMEAEHDESVSPVVRRSASILLALHPDRSSKFVAVKQRVDRGTVQTVVTRYQLGGVELVLAPPPAQTGRRFISADQKERVRHLGATSNLTLHEIAAKGDVSSGSVANILNNRFTSASARRARIRSLERQTVLNKPD